MVVEADSDLPQVALAIHPPRRLAGGLHRGQQEGDQHTDNRNHYQQLDERKRSRKRDPSHESLPRNNQSRAESYNAIPVSISRPEKEMEENATKLSRRGQSMMPGLGEIPQAP